MFKKFNKPDEDEYLHSDTYISEARRAAAAALGLKPERLASIAPPVEPMQGAGVYLLLDRELSSAAAKEFVEALLIAITPPRGRKRVETRQALGALVGELIGILADERDGYGYHPIGAGTFSGERIGYQPYIRVIKRLAAKGCVRVVPGKAAPPVAGSKGRATAIKPLLPLLNMAASYGITPANVRDHFREVFEPVVLKAPLRWPPK